MEMKRVWYQNKNANQYQMKIGTVDTSSEYGWTTDILTANEAQGLKLRLEFVECGLLKYAPYHTHPLIGQRYPFHKTPKAFLSKYGYSTIYSGYYFLSVLHVIRF